MSFPYSKTFTYNSETKRWSNKINELKNRANKGISVGLDYSWKIENIDDNKIVVKISSKSVVTVIIIIILTGTLIPGINLESFLIFAVIVSYLLYFLFFSIFSSDVYSKLKPYLIEDKIIDNGCENCCPACGSFINENDLYCPSCGLRVKQNNFTKPLDIAKLYQKESSPRIRYIYKRQKKDK